MVLLLITYADYHVLCLSTRQSYSQYVPLIVFTETVDLDLTALIQHFKMWSVPCVSPEPSDYQESWGDLWKFQ